VAKSFPVNTSKPPSGVSSKKPRVPSRFSSLTESEVKNNPASATPAKLRPESIEKSAPPTSN
jgi:hypothetical protein